MGPPLRAGRGRAGTSDPGMLAGRVRAHSPGSGAGPLPPAGPLQDTPRPAAGHLRARHVLPLRPAPRAPPGLGAVTGGPGWTRRDQRLEDRAGERGAAGRSGRPGVWASELRSVGHPEGRPGRGWGGRRNPRPEAAGRGRADRLVPAAGRGPPGVGRACHPRRKVGPPAVPANFPKGTGPSVPWEPKPQGPVSRETGLGRLAAPLAGRLPGVRDLELELFESQIPPCHPRRREAVAYYPDIAVCRLP